MQFLCVKFLWIILDLTTTESLTTEIEATTETLTTEIEATTESLTTEFEGTTESLTTELEATTEKMPPDSDGGKIEAIRWILKRQDTEIDGQMKKEKVRCVLCSLANQIFLKKFFHKFLKFSEVSKFVSKNFLFFQKSMVFRTFSEVYIIAAKM